MVKSRLNRLGPTFLCVHGNHEIRPANIPSYKLKDWRGGRVWVEDKYPSLLFAKDGEIFDLDGQKCLVIGGAYSVDRAYRLARGYGWWPDEQPSEIIKRYAESRIDEEHIDIVLSHTCPFRLEPVEAFLPMIDQKDIDSSTELWLDMIEERLLAQGYKAWYCGHWHIDKHTERLHFLYRTFETIGEGKDPEKNDGREHAGSHVFDEIKAGLQQAIEYEKGNRGKT